MHKSISENNVKRLFDSYQKEWTRQNDEVKKFFESHKANRKSLWDIIIQFNSILIGAFSIIIAFNI